MKKEIDKEKIDKYWTMTPEDRLENKVVLIDMNDPNFVDETIYNYKLNEIAKKVLKAYIKELQREEEGRI